MTVDRTIPFSSPKAEDWSQLRPSRYGLNWPPNTIITAERLDAMFRADASDLAKGFFERQVMYRNVDALGNVTYKVCTITLYIMAADLANIYSAGSSTIRGHLLGEDGALQGALEYQYEVAGQLFPYYYYNVGDSDDENVVTDLSEGDAIWVVRRGYGEAHNASGGPAVANGPVVSAANGHSQNGTAWVGAGFNTVPMLEENDTNYKRLGRWLAATADGSVGAVHWEMPPRYHVP